MEPSLEDHLISSSSRPFEIFTRSVASLRKASSALVLIDLSSWLYYCLGLATHYENADRSFFLALLLSGAGHPLCHSLCTSHLLIVQILTAIISWSLFLPGFTTVWGWPPTVKTPCLIFLGFTNVRAGHPLRVELFSLSRLEVL